MVDSVRFEETARFFLVQALFSGNTPVSVRADIGLSLVRALVVMTGGR